MKTGDSALSGNGSLPAGLSLEAIRDLGDNLQPFIDALPLVVMILDLDHRVVMTNRVARKMAGGIDPVDAGMRCHQLSHHIDVPCDDVDVPCPLKKVLETRAPVTVTHTHFDAEGNEILHEVTATPILDEAGEVVRIIEFCPDVTVLKRTEASLQERTSDLRRKVRELNCLYGISDLAAKPGVSLNDLIRGTLDLVHSTWQDPAMTCVRIILGDQEFRTENFEETKWRLSAPIHSGSEQAGYAGTELGGHADIKQAGSRGTEQAGTLVVFYLQERDNTEGSPFLEEEESLLKAVSGRLETFIENRRIEEALKTLNENLEQKVAERTASAERKARQLRKLASELTQSEQRERKRLARVLHDHLQQLLVGARFHLGMVKQRYQSDESLQGTIRQIDGMIDESIEASRSLTVELSPPILFEGSLPQVLDWLCLWMQEKHGLTVDLRVRAGADPEAEDIRVFLFQAVRELLFNVVKHAGTSRADVSLSPDGQNRVRITVIDKGRGFDPADHDAPGSRTSVFGLYGIKERLDLLGGTMKMESTPGRGTCITLLAPASSDKSPRDHEPPSGDST